MSEYGLPCIACGVALRNVVPGSTENQPYEGVMCTTRGNYGSTVFDGTRGEFLEFNVCDTCLVNAGERGHVLVGQNRRPVVDALGGHIGWEKVDRPLVNWRRGIPGYLPSDVVEVMTGEDFDELNQATDRFGRPKISWNYPRLVRGMVERAWQEVLEREKYRK